MLSTCVHVHNWELWYNVNPVRMKETSNEYSYVGYEEQHSALARPSAEVIELWFKEEHLLEISGRYKLVAFQGDCPYNANLLLATTKPILDPKVSPIWNHPHNAGHKGVTFQHSSKGHSEYMDIWTIRNGSKHVAIDIMKCFRCCQRGCCCAQGEMIFLIVHVWKPPKIIILSYSIISRNMSAYLMTSLR